jgi:hypothetical protein
MIRLEEFLEFVPIDIAKIIGEYDAATDLEKMTYVLMNAPIGGIVIETTFFSAMHRSNNGFINAVFTIIPRDPNYHEVRVIVERYENNPNFAGITRTVSQFVEMVRANALVLQFGYFNFISSGDPDDILQEMMDEY